MTELVGVYVLDLRYGIRDMKNSMFMEYSGMSAVWSEAEHRANAVAWNRHSVLNTEYLF